MRTVSSTIETAITTTPGIKVVVRAEIEKSFISFSSLSSDNPYEASPFGTITETPRPQCVGYSPTRSAIVTFVVANNGGIYAMVAGSSGTTSLGLTTDPACKPGFWDLGDGTGILWWWNESSGQVSASTINMSSFSVTNTDNFTLSPPDHAIDIGSLNAISATEAVLTYVTTGGGIGAAYYDGVSWNYWNRRFISPNRVVDNSYWTVYTAAALLNGYVYVYLTDLDTGEVKGVEYDTSRDQWSNTYTALPADLCRFCISNALVANGYIHLAGQYHRTGDLSGAQIYSLVLRSSDGRNFAWDRYTHLSTLGYHFHIAINAGGDAIWASDRNKVGTSTLSYFFSSSTGTKVTLGIPSDVIEFNSSGNQSATLKIAAGNETYMSHAIVARHSRCRIYLGYYTSAVDVEYVLFGTYIIVRKSKAYRDGVRQLTLDLVSEGFWKTTQIAFPFYAEIISKPTLRDDCDERDHLYPAPAGTGISTELAADFWFHEGYTDTGITARTFLTPGKEGAERADITGVYTYGFMTQLLSENLGLSEDPVLTATTMRIKVYGWAHTSDSSRNNDTIACRLITADPDTDVESTTVGSLASTYARFPRFYPDPNVDGSYPIEFDFTGLSIGDKVLRVVIIISNTEATYTTTFCPERVTLNNVSFTQANISPSLTWKQTRPSTFDPTDPTLLEVPAVGVPYIQFMTKPYTAFNFSIHAKFVHEDGDYPVSSGTAGWGVVGMGEDGSNYILARMNITNSRIELVSCKDGVETVLTYYSTAPNEYHSLLMEHLDGTITIHYATDADPDEFGNPVITYHWDEITDGAISTSTSGIMHVGVYGIKSTPGFQITGMNINDSDGICMLPADDMTPIDDFPSSGIVVIDDVEYSYTGKSPNTKLYGPYGARNTGDYGDGMACEIALYLPDATGDWVAGHLLSSDNGHSWVIDSSLWEVVHYNSGVPNPLRNRSRHMGSSINGNWVGTNTRMYIGPALLAPTAVDSSQTIIHSKGSWCYIAASNRIWVQEVIATTKDSDATVKDMIRVLCATASISPTFPGDYVIASDTAATNEDPFGNTNFFPGGLDISFTIPSISTNSVIGIRLNDVLINGETDPLILGVRNDGGNLSAYASVLGGSTAWVRPSAFIATGSHVLRILFHKEFVSIYIDKNCLATFAFASVTWPATVVAIRPYSSSSYTITDIIITELFDWREAIYIESEMSASSAIGSVIQERPVEIQPTTDGSLTFTYNLLKATVTYTSAISKRILTSHTNSESVNTDAGSDAQVHSVDVGFISYPTYANVDGFFTKVLRLSGLDTGAENAGKILLEKANENQYTNELEMRIDVRLEPGDKIVLEYTLSGTGTIISTTMIVDEIAIRIGEGVSNMRVRARTDI